MNLIKHLQSSILTQKLFSSGDTVIIGVSGGPDSVALIHILLTLRQELGLKLHIAHYNHALRKDADADQEFVKNLAQKLNIPFHTEEWSHLKRSPKGSLEELAREKRFDFFIRLAKKINADSVALAHTQDDLAETVLLRMLRGTGLQGLRAILPKRKIHGISFIRPLLQMSKKETLSYLKQKKMTFRIDPTNRQTKFFRNKIRLELLPLLDKEYVHGMHHILANLARNVAIDFDYLAQQAQKEFKKIGKYSQRDQSVSLNLKNLLKLHPAIRHMVIRLAIEHLQLDTNRLTLSHIQEIDDLIDCRPTKSIVHLPKNLIVEKQKNILLIHY